MLTHLQIRDFAIIDLIELEVRAGLTVLTGETGAGKSIVVDALALLAGGKGGAEVVRAGTERAELSATFDISESPAALARSARGTVGRRRRRTHRAPGHRQRWPLARLPERRLGAAAAPARRRRAHRRHPRAARIPVADPRQRAARTARRFRRQPRARRQGARSTQGLDRAREPHRRARRQGRAIATRASNCSASRSASSKRST